MVEIIPNWHPIFVHFTVAMFTISSILYAVAYLFNTLRVFPKIASELEITGRWCLWIVGILVIGTVLAGLQAYNTVRHDTPSHLAMTDHRNWALITAAGILLASLWSAWRTYRHKAITIFFVIFLFIIQGLLLATAWRGAELVFRHGLGVMSLPKAEGEGHQHHHEMEMNNDHDPNSHDHAH